MVISKRDHLTGELQHAKKAKYVTEDGQLEWVLVCEAQIEYIYHLVLILGSHMDKLPEKNYC